MAAKSGCASAPCVAIASVYSSMSSRAHGERARCQTARSARDDDATRVWRPLATSLELERPLAGRRHARRTAQDEQATRLPRTRRVVARLARSLLRDTFDVLHPRQHRFAGVAATASRTAGCQGQAHVRWRWRRGQGAFSLSLLFHRRTQRRGTFSMLRGSC